MKISVHTNPTIIVFILFIFPYQNGWSSYFISLSLIISGNLEFYQLEEFQAILLCLRESLSILDQLGCSVDAIREKDTGPAGISSAVCLSGLLLCR